MRSSIVSLFTLVLFLSTVNEALSGHVVSYLASRADAEDAATSDESKNLDTTQFDQNNQESIVASAYEKDETVQVQDANVGFDQPLPLNQLQGFNPHVNPDIKEAMKTLTQQLDNVVRFLDEL